MNDYFESNTISLILAWIISIPFIVFLIAKAIIILFEKTEGIPRILWVWVLLCLFLFSPLRYIILQFFIGISYPVQSFSAFLYSMILAFYIPLVFGILACIGISLPLYGAYLIAKFKVLPSIIRFLLCAIATPFICIFASLLFYFVLPYAAYSTHWLRARDVISATNGLPKYYYEYVVEQWTPLQYPAFTREIGLGNLSEKERLRSHIAAVYLGDKEFSFFVHKSYPEGIPSPGSR